MSASEDWSAATFEGTDAQQRRDAATAPPARRLAWLEEALRLTEASGALARARRERQAQCDQWWRAGTSGPAASDA